MGFHNENIDQPAAVKTAPVQKTPRRILIMTAVDAERNAVLRGLGHLPESLKPDILLAGVGPIAAAVNTAKALAAHPYELVISAGIGGGFPGIAGIGSLVVADQIIAADLGVETAEGFCRLEDLGFGLTQVPADLDLSCRLFERLRKSALPAHQGPILTVSTASGTEKSAARLAARIPGAAAEAMEGFGVALAAQDFGVPILEIRAISNLVGPRNRADWKIKEALAVLEAAASLLTEVI